MTVRAVDSLYLYPALDIDQQLKEFERRFDNEAGSLLSFDTAKIYIDGILDLGTAAMIRPHDVPIDSNYPSGFYYFKPNVLQRYVDALRAMEYRMNFHVIGDAAVRSALDSIESISDTKPWCCKKFRPGTAALLL